MILFFYGHYYSLLVPSPVSCYTSLMSITQTVTIPEWEPSVPHRLTIDIPREVPAGPVILTFTPAPRSGDDECPICAQHRDPVTGNPRYKPEIYASMQEVEDMTSGKIPDKLHRYSSAEEMWADLDKDDLDD